MKRILLLSCLICSTCNIIIAQDTIVTQNIHISEVSSINYEDGERTSFSATENQHLEKITDKENLKNDFKGKYFMLGAGTGKSYGGYGLRVQWRFGGKQGFGVHAGAGYYPKAPVLASAGVKYFPYKNLYIDAQFGTALMKRTVTTGHWDSYVIGYIGIPTYVIDSTYDASYLGYGPSLLIGGDWTWGKNIAYGFNFGLGVSYIINMKPSFVVSVIYPKINQKFRVAGDLGFLIRF